jgi:hypothetical protein
VRGPAQFESAPCQHPLRFSRWQAGGMSFRSKRKQVKVACVVCARGKRACSGEPFPCERCVRLGRGSECVPVSRQKRGNSEDGEPEMDYEAYRPEPSSMHPAGTQQPPGWMHPQMYYGMQPQMPFAAYPGEPMGGIAPNVGGMPPYGGGGMEHVPPYAMHSARHPSPESEHSSRVLHAMGAPHGHSDPTSYVDSYYQGFPPQPRAYMLPTGQIVRLPPLPGQSELALLHARTPPQPMWQQAMAPPPLGHFSPSPAPPSALMNPAGEMSHVASGPTPDVQSAAVALTSSVRNMMSQHPGDPPFEAPPMERFLPPKTAGSTEPTVWDLASQRVAQKAPPTTAAPQEPVKRDREDEDASPPKRPKRDPAVEPPASNVNSSSSNGPNPETSQPPTTTAAPKRTNGTTALRGPSLGGRSVTLGVGGGVPLMPSEAIALRDCLSKIAKARSWPSAKLAELIRSFPIAASFVDYGNSTGTDAATGAALQGNADRSPSKNNSDWGPVALAANEECHRVFNSSSAQMHADAVENSNMAWIHPYEAVRRLTVVIKAQSRRLKQYTYDGLYVARVVPPPGPGVDEHGVALVPYASFRATEVVNVVYDGTSSRPKRAITFFVGVVPTGAVLPAGTVISADHVIAALEEETKAGADASDEASSKRDEAATDDGGASTSISRPELAEHQHALWDATRHYAAQSHLEYEPGPPVDRCDSPAADSSDVENLVELAPETGLVHANKALASFGALSRTTEVPASFQAVVQASHTAQDMDSASDDAHTSPSEGDAESDRESVDLSKQTPPE